MADIESVYELDAPWLAADLAVVNYLKENYRQIMVARSNLIMGLNQEPDFLFLPMKFRFDIPGHMTTKFQGYKILLTDVEQPTWGYDTLTMSSRY